MPLSQKDIENLISCEKRMTTPPQKELYLRQGSLRNDMSLESTDGTNKFSAFIRVNAAFEEDFSVGLTYIDPEGRSIILMRCNGPHGGFNFAEHHNQFHIHRACANHIYSGLKGIGKSSVTQEYSSWREAVRYFLSHCNIIGGETHFKFFNQIDWLEDHVEED